MTSTTARVLGLSLSIALLAGGSAQAQRSFVGKKLSGIRFVDTEGHTVDPEHYLGSVLVMVAGIPW